MSLVSPNIWERQTPVIRAIVVGIALIVVVGGVLLLADKCGTYKSNKAINAAKGNIANTVNEISNVKVQIGNLEQKKAELDGRLQRDAETLANNVFGQDETKKVVNQALANYNAALKANSSVNVTAEDLKRIVNQVNEDQ